MIGKPVPLCDMEDLEDDQYFDDYYLPDLPPPPDAGIKISGYEGN